MDYVDGEVGVLLNAVLFGKVSGFQSVPSTALTCPPAAK